MVLLIGTVPASAVQQSDVLSGSPTCLSAPDGVSFTGTVGAFTDSNQAASAGGFNATIDWGDATTSAGSVNGGSGSFSVSGTHTYASPGTYPVMVTLHQTPPGTAGQTVTSTIHVSNGLAAACAAQPTATEGTTTGGTLATFSDSDTSLTAADFTATVAWGDGVTSPGTVSGSSGVFSVSGTHTYAEAGSYGFTATITEKQPNGLQASTAGTASIADAQLQASGSNPATITTPAFAGALGTISDQNPDAVPSDFTVRIDWGDGASSTGTVSGSAGSFTISGSHTYAVADRYVVGLHVVDVGGSTADAGTQIDDRALTDGAGRSVSGTEGHRGTWTLASFTGPRSSTPGQYLAIVDWGDGTRSIGTVTGSGGSFAVSGSHTYRDAQRYPTKITVADTTTSGNQLTARGEVSVADAPLRAAGLSRRGSTLSFHGVVATVVDANQLAPEGELQAGIDWGDGTRSAGTVHGAAGHFVVSGIHRYRRQGRYRLTVVVIDGPGAAATATTRTELAIRLDNRFRVSRLVIRRDGTVSFDLRLPGAGQVDVLETAARRQEAATAALIPGPTRFAFARAHLNVRRAGTIHVRIVPSARGRRLVLHHRGGPLRINLWITFQPTGGATRIAVFLGRFVTA